MTLRFGSIPVTLSGSFFIVAVLLGGNLRRPDLVAIWVVVVLLSVLVHELGHALMAKAFGLAPQIQLHAMGGTTSWSPTKKIGNARRILITLAGPGAGFLLGAATWIGIGQLAPTLRNPLVLGALEQLFWVNIIWGVLNLVPMMPLDGGSIMRSTLDAMTRGRGERPARIISVVVAAIACACALGVGQWWYGGLAVWFAFANINALRQKPAA